ncbi:MAG: hypothetical protein GXO45_02745 [Aquificae bacterium]|nr:hypothetical protein [Aquificota bacterium]
MDFLRVEKVFRVMPITEEKFVKEPLPLIRKRVKRRLKREEEQPPQEERKGRIDIKV